MTAPAHRNQSTNMSNVRVVGRVRPLAEYERANGSSEVIHTLPTSDGPSQKSDILYVEPLKGEKRWFELDSVFDSASSQEHIYVQSGAQNAVINDIFKGFNCTILAYGQTGSGKTFTMGTAPLKSADLTDYCGVIPRACSDLFKQIREKCNDNAQVELSYLEVYNEEIRDLLSDTKTNSQLRIREHLNGEVYVRGLQSRTVSSSADVGTLMEEASKRRVTASTNMNDVSSRSHAMCFLRVKGVLEDSSKFKTTLSLVDLAGSERLKKTGAVGDIAQEGISINKGLFVLGQVVSALAEQRPKMKRKPPYRDSKLTRLLQDSLGGNSRTIMIACVSPADCNLEESVNTLRYAASARNITNVVTRNVVKAMSQEEAAKILRENELLKQEVKELQQAIEKMSTDFAVREESPSEEENEEMANEDDSISMHDLKELPEGEVTKKIAELEKEVKQLTHALHRAQDELRTTTQNTLELPALKVQVAQLMDELNESRQLVDETEHLRQDYEELKVEASTARKAADRLSHMVHDQLQLSQSKSMGSVDSDSSIGPDLLDETNVKKEFAKAKASEAWVGFIVHVYSLFKEDMRILGDHFNEVTRIATSDDILLSDSQEQKKEQWWKNTKRESQDEKGLREKMLEEQITSYNERFLEIEDALNSRFDSLIGVQDSVQKDREQLETQLSFEDLMDASRLNRNDVLLKWLKLALGMTAKASSESYDDESSVISDRSTREPFSLFHESASSVAFDDSLSVSDRPQMALLEEDADESDDDEDLVF